MNRKLLLTLGEFIRFLNSFKQMCYLWPQYLVGLSGGCIRNKLAKSDVSFGRQTMASRYYHTRRSPSKHKNIHHRQCLLIVLNDISISRIKIYRLVVQFFIRTRLNRTGDETSNLCLQKNKKLHFCILEEDNLLDLATYYCLS